MGDYAFDGLFKYLGRDSFSQDWKSGRIFLKQEADKWVLDTFLKCNSNHRMGSHELSKSNVVDINQKSQRLVMNFKGGKIFHFKGNSNSAIVTQLEKAIRAILEKSSTSGQLKSRAEVGNSMLPTPAKPVLGQRSTPDRRSPARAIEISPAKSSVPVFHFKSSPSEQRVPDCSLPESSPAASPHRFTSVKENKRPRHDFNETPPDDESKENQHRGLLSPESNQPNWRGDRQPLGVSSTAFYGGSLQGSSSTINFRIRRGGTLSIPSVTRKRLASDVSYSWSRTSTSASSSRQHTPALQGFANIGNTCYMNAILQSLFSLDTFVTDLVNLQKQHGKALLSSSLAFALVRLLHLKRRPHMLESQKLELLRGVKRAISSTAKRFSGSQQHDAHEFLGQVLDQLKEEVIKVMKDINAEMDTTASVAPSCDGSSPVSDLPLSPSPSEENGGLSGPAEKLTAFSPVINPTSVNFEFEVVHSIVCLSCQEQLQKAEQFNDLSLDIPATQLPGVNLSLQDALDVFLEKEQIEYTCEKCGHKKAEVSHRFTKLPRVLVLHLKRYTFDTSSSHNSKMRQYVHIPRFITLSDHCDMHTQPHAPAAFFMHNSLLKSPPNSAHRRRRLTFNGERNGDVSPSSKMRRISGDFDEKSNDKNDFELEKKSSDDSHNFEEDLELAIQLSKQESAHRLGEDGVIVDLADDEDEQLKQALALSIQEMESGPTDHSYTNSTDDKNNNNNSNADAFAWMLNNAPLDNNADIAEADLANMTMDEQIQLAINRSLAQPSLPQQKPCPSSPLSVSLHNGASGLGGRLSQHMHKLSQSEKDAGRLRTERDCVQSGATLGQFKKPSSLLSPDHLVEEKTHDIEAESDEMKVHNGKDLRESSEHNSLSSAFWDDDDACVPTGKARKPVENSHSDLCEVDMDVEIDFLEHGTLSSSVRNGGLESSVHSGLLGEDSEMGLRNHADFVNSSKSSTDSSNNSVTDSVRRSMTMVKYGSVDRARTVSMDQPANRDLADLDSIDGERQAPEGAEMTGFVSHNVGFVGCISKSQPLRPSKKQESAGGEDSDSSLPDLNFDTDSDDGADTVQASKASYHTETKPFLENSFPSKPALNNHVTGVGSKTETESTVKKAEVEDLWNLAENTSPDANDNQFKLSVPLQNRSENETTPDKKERKRDAEEKENLSPAVGKGVLQPWRLDKQMEAKIAQHMARATEVEKGNVPFSYRLVSVVNHLGASSNTGHYISDVFDMRKQAWFSYNDSNVQRSSEVEVRNSRSRSGYIFFFMSKDIYDDFCSKIPKGNELAIRP